MALRPFSRCQGNPRSIRELEHFWRSRTAFCFSFLCTFWRWGRGFLMVPYRGWAVSVSMTLLLLGLPSVHMVTSLITACLWRTTVTFLPSAMRLPPQSFQSWLSRDFNESWNWIDGLGNLMACLSGPESASFLWMYIIMLETSALGKLDSHLLSPAPIRFSFSLGWPWTCYLTMNGLELLTHLCLPNAEIVLILKSVHYIYLCVCVHVCTCICMYHSVHVEVKRQLPGIGSLSPPCESLV